MSNAAEFENAGKEAIDNAVRSFSAVTRGFQQIATETTEYTKRSYERSAKMFEQLSQTRSVERVVELQNEYAKAAYEGWVSQATRMGEIYTDIAKEVYKPFETVAQRATGFAQSTVKDAA
ncbi:phasin family protein [Aureimonas leprariae]|uniref:Phasin family protein n=1 Tax=Plantimonas leprariae TaxID=2615207 RepID=A0A7V7PL19_9HYPH|nr:phasin family protein [Aureimonas leprariae]KAB0676674.1 phasin family protein [Aureimonas leprariae]